MAVLALLIPFAICGILILQYLRASFRLLEIVQAQAEDLWHRLGQPRRVWVKSNEGGMHTIQPLWPWLGWVWRADTAGLHPRVARELSRTSGLLKTALVAFIVTMLAFLGVLGTA